MSRFNAWRHGDRSELTRHARAELRRTFVDTAKPDSVDPSEFCKVVTPAAYRQSLLGVDCLAKAQQAAKTAGTTRDLVTAISAEIVKAVDHDPEVLIRESLARPSVRVKDVTPDVLPDSLTVSPSPEETSASWDFVPAAQFLRAVQLAEEWQTLPPNARTDTLFVRAFRYIKGGRDRMFDPALWEAQQLFLRGGNVRWMIEAALIGGLSHAGVSELVPVSPNTIEAYEAYFYDVRRFLKCRPFMLAQLLPFGLNGVLADDPDTFWKLLSYTCGVSFWLKYMDPAGGFDAGEWSTFCGMLRHSLAKNALAATWQTVPSGENAKALVAMHVRMEDDATRKQGRGDGHNATAELFKGITQAAGELLRTHPVLAPPDPIAGLSHRSEGLPLTSAGVQPTNAG